MARQGRIYRSILSTLSSGRLTEPFRSADFEKACPGFSKSTYRTFLSKHAQRNPNNAAELFRRVEPGLYRLVQPQGQSSTSKQSHEEAEPSTPFDAKRDQYVKLLEPLFLPADPVSNDIIRYFASLLRVLGMEDQGWDPYAESRAVLDDINGFFKVNLPKSVFQDPSRTTWRLGLLLYSHIVEMDAPYEVMTNLLRIQLGHGYSPSPFYQFLTSAEKKSFRRRGISTGRKIEIIKKLSDDAGLAVGQIFDEFYKNQLRNAISHSDYILTDQDFRCRGGISGTRAFRISYEELDRILTSAKAFIAAFFYVEQLARHVWGTQKQRAIPYDLRYKGLIEILVDDRDLMCGFRVHWPNGSESTYRRTEDGVDMTNCILDLKNATVDLFVDLYARKPGPFSPLVERDAKPIYTKLEGCDDAPTWPESGIDDM